MKNKNGITLIALVISIIVMLILAGVSINATIGDNGVIGKAQDTVFLNSCAYLEEYFNQLYATCAMDGASEGDTPLHTIMNNGYQHYFFSTSEGSCLKKNYINEETGESQTLVLYLVKKEQLPADIQAQLTGGEGLESRDYRKLKGCYGITSDLQAYYCEDGLETLLGLSTSDLNADSPDIVYADENSALASAVNGGTAAVTNQGLKTIKRLTIDSVEELSILSDFARFINLTEVYFSGIEIPSLSGIEGAVNSLTYIKFTNCNVQDYSAINGLTSLTQLYLVTPVGKNEEIARLGSTDKGIANGEFSKLQYFGIVGNEAYLNNTTINYNSSVRYGITDISSLSNFSDVTKKAIKYMNLQNLQLTSIASIADFTGVYLLRLECNALITFEGIQKMSGLKYLIAPNQYSNTTSSYTLGINEGTTASDIDALKYIYKNNNSNTELYYVDLRNNNKLKYVDSLSTCTGIRYLYLASCTSIQNANTIASILGNCGANYSLEGIYGLEIIADTTKVLSLAGKSMTIEQFEQLKNRTALTHLNLQGITITDASGTKLTSTTTPSFNEEVNNILATCTNLQYLSLNNLSNLTTLDFVNTTPNIKELILTGTAITDLTILNTKAMQLCTLKINNTNIDLTTIQPTLNRLKSGYYWTNSSGLQGMLLDNWSLIKQLEKCTDLTRMYNKRWAASIQNTTDILNLSNLTNLTDYSMSGHNFRIKMPSNIVSIYDIHFTGPIDYSLCSNLKNVSIYCLNTTVFTSAQWEESISTLQYCTSLTSFRFTRSVGNKIEYKWFSQYCKDLPNLKTLQLGAYSGFRNSWNITGTLDGLEGLTQLENLTIQYVDLKDISALASLTNLKTLDLTETQFITDITPLVNLTNLQTLKISGNSIADVYPLMNCTKLETLYIQNNALSDFGYYKDINGISRGYEVMDVFYDLNYEKKGSLKNLYMSGNNFDDTEILWDLNWTTGDGGIFQE